MPSERVKSRNWESPPPAPHQGWEGPFTGELWQYWPQAAGGDVVIYPKEELLRGYQRSHSVVLFSDRSFLNF